MIYLLFSVLSSTGIFIIFRLFKRHGINTLKAIIINYGVAFTIGTLAYERSLVPAELFVSSWLPGALLLGLLFIVIFNLMAVTAQTNGLSVASVASKMSVIIPVIFGVLLYAEQLGPIQVIGILMAFIFKLAAIILQLKIVISI